MQGAHATSEKRATSTNHFLTHLMPSGGQMMGTDKEAEIQGRQPDRSIYSYLQENSISGRKDTIASRLNPYPAKIRYPIWSSSSPGQPI